MERQIRDAADALAHALQESEAYTAFVQARELAFARPHIRAAYEEYCRLQVQVQAAEMSGNRDEAQEKRLQQLVELLHFDEDASAFLLADYTLQQTLGEVYRRLASAVGLDPYVTEG